MTPMYPLPADVIPHRPPFLLLDEVVECTDTYVRAVKTFRADEPLLMGHFPGRPIVPGVILVEGLAQALAYLVCHRIGATTMLLARIEKARVRRPVLPEELVEYQVRVEKQRMGLIYGSGIIMCEGEQAAEAKVLGARDT